MKICANDALHLTRGHAYLSGSCSKSFLAEIACAGSWAGK